MKAHMGKLRKDKKMWDKNGSYKMSNIPILWNNLWIGFVAFS